MVCRAITSVGFSATSGMTLFLIYIVMIVTLSRQDSRFLRDLFSIKPIFAPHAFSYQRYGRIAIANGVFVFFCISMIIFKRWMCP